MRGRDEGKEGKQREGRQLEEMVDRKRQLGEKGERDVGRKLRRKTGTRTL